MTLLTLETKQPINSLPDMPEREGAEDNFRVNSLLFYFLELCHNLNLGILVQEKKKWHVCMYIQILCYFISVILIHVRSNSLTSPKLEANYGQLFGGWEAGLKNIFSPPAPGNH